MHASYNPAAPDLLHEAALQSWLIKCETLNKPLYGNYCRGTRQKGTHFIGVSAVCAAAVHRGVVLFHCWGLRRPKLGKGAVSGLWDAVSGVGVSTA